MKEASYKIRVILRIGIILMVLGLLCLVIKALSPESIGADGILREAFYLLPVGFCALFAGIATVLGGGIALLVKRIKK